MPISIIIAAAFVLVSALDTWAASRTMRLDYYHTGTATSETFAVDRLVVEPTPWPGNPSRPIDDTNLGKYLFEVVDRETNRVIYSRGFASVFGEWETTGEAKTAAKSFHESLRFPMPERPVQVLLKKYMAKWEQKEAEAAAAATAAPPTTTESPAEQPQG